MPFRFEIAPCVTIVNQNIEEVFVEIISKLLQFIRNLFDGRLVMQALNFYQLTFPQGVVSRTQPNVLSDWVICVDGLLPTVKVARFPMMDFLFSAVSAPLPSAYGVITRQL